MKKLVYLIVIVIVSACHSDTEPEFASNPVVAHRGAWKHTGAPQNSFEAFEIALAKEYGGVEFDVHMTADGILVANHDPVYFGMLVQESDYDHLNVNKLSNGEDLPLVSRFLERGIQQTNTRLFLEIKPSVIGRDHANATVARVVDMVQAFNAQDWVIYISFDHQMLQEVLRLDPKAKVMYLNNSRTPQVLYYDGFYGPAYHYGQFRIHEHWIQECHDLGLQVYAWTVNDPLEMVYFLNQRIRYIATDEPEILMDMQSNIVGR